MKAFCAVAVIGLSLIGFMDSGSSQPYGYRDRDYRDRDYRDRDYRDRDYGYRHRMSGFDEREYLHCNPDVLRAVRRGEQPSGWAHYQQFGRRENRQLNC